MNHVTTVSINPPYATYCEVAFRSRSNQRSTLTLGLLWTVSGFYFPPLLQ
jgi:hypothetical protein